MADDKKIIEVIEEQLRARGIDPAELKQTLIDSLSAAGEMEPISDAEMKCMAQMIDAIVPGTFALIMDNGGAITAIGNVPRPTQALMALGYAFMYLNAHPQDIDQFTSLIQTGMRGSKAVREAFTLGPDQ